MPYAIHEADMCRDFVIFVIPVISVQPTILVLTLDATRENDPKLQRRMCKLSKRL